jgi:hypothetical protein
MSDSQRQLTPHLFAEGCINGGMVVFPAESFHSSRKITQRGGYKRALKLDVWLYIKPPSQDITHQVATNGEGYHNLKMVFNKQQCRCKLCQPAILVAMGLAKELYHILPKTLPFSVLKHMANFTVPTLGQFKHHDCGCKEAYYNKWTTDLGEEKGTLCPFYTTPEMCKCTCPLCSFSYTCHGSWVESWEGYCEDNAMDEDEDEDRNGRCNGYDY